MLSLYKFKKGDYVKVLGSKLFLEKPYYMIREINNGLNYITSHPIEIIDDYGSKRWLKIEDVKCVNELREEIINEILK